MTFRIGSFNTHYFEDASNNFRYKEQLQLLKSVNLDVVALLEVYHPVHINRSHRNKNKDQKKISVLDHFSKNLGMKYIFHEYHRRYGIAIFSSYKILHSKTFIIKDTMFGKRGIVRITVSLKEKYKINSLDENEENEKEEEREEEREEEKEEEELETIDIFAVHIDHRLETTRLKQMKVVWKFINENKRSERYVLVGDFNCLSSPSHYPKNEWRSLVEVRKKNSWESPRVDVYNSIIEKGLIDTWGLRKKKILHHQGTCFYKTRIDYIFSSPEFLIDSGPYLVTYKKVDTESSDHNLVYVEGKIPKNDKK
ncbi:hypothetical protein M0813_08129 [Anaeramoeba flamelloides]|uniref:Endonuclease/exonuclease/phosphatase domain-containing protein n=1 Tax=Anaeramoeba flamelloides TaxID=1746091 RepID=A0ABQ8X973_9EUKA|nr:hypothetical protein M0813_08129 [Anaeramoeba flamelloides]